MYSENGKARIAAATMVAGPTFLISYVLLDASQTGRALAYSPGIVPILQMALFLVASAIFGAVLAILPCAVGSGIMMWAGRDNLGCRLPAMWGLAGAILGGLPTFALGHDLSAAVSMTATGAVCAIVARIGVRWVEPSLPPPHRMPAYCIQTIDLMTGENR